MLQLFLLFNVLIIIVYAHMLCGVTEEVRGQLESPFCPSAMWIPGLKNKCSYQPKTSQPFLANPERLGPEWYGNPEEGGKKLSEGREHPQGHLGECEVKAASAGGGRRVSLAEQVVGAKGRRRRDQLSCLCESD